MKIINKENKSIFSDSGLRLKFVNIESKNFSINCNILKDNFYLDSQNYFPLTHNFFCFQDIFSWGDELKYNNFYSQNFAENFIKNMKNFKELSNIFILGSSAADNYYRNMITFLPRIFFNNEKNVNVAIHRNSSNKFRNFIKVLCKKINVEIKFIFLDDGFYNFSKSLMPQFLKKNDSYKILNSLKIRNISYNKSRNIYIARQNCSSRNLVNEVDVIDKLKKLNFRIVDLNQFDIFEQIKLFSNSDTIISSTGSALTNIVFCREGTKIIEISPKYNFEYENRFKYRYSSIAENLKLNYKRVEADPIKIQKINKKIKKNIHPDVIKNSNYYKDLILKLENINNLI